MNPMEIVILKNIYIAIILLLVYNYNKYKFIS